MTGGRIPERLVATILTLAIIIAPFIAMVFRTEAGLVVMAVALVAGSLLLREALDVAPEGARRWLRLGILVNLALAVACLGLAVWLLSRG